jgi:hypothetical protein
MKTVPPIAALERRLTSSVLSSAASSGMASIAKSLKKSGLPSLDDAVSLDFAMTLPATLFSAIEISDVIAANQTRHSLRKETSLAEDQWETVLQPVASQPVAGHRAAESPHRAHDSVFAALEAEILDEI